MLGNFNYEKYYLEERKKWYTIKELKKYGLMDTNRGIFICRTHYLVMNNRGKTIWIKRQFPIEGLK